MVTASPADSQITRMVDSRLWISGFADFRQSNCSENEAQGHEAGFNRWLLNDWIAPAAAGIKHEGRNRA